MTAKEFFKENKWINQAAIARLMDLNPERFSDKVLGKYHFKKEEIIKLQSIINKKYKYLGKINLIFSF